VPAAVPLFGPQESTAEGAAPATSIAAGPSLLWGVPLAGLLLLGVVLSSGRLVQPRPLPRREAPPAPPAQVAPAAQPAPSVLVTVQPRDLDGMLRAAQAAVVAGRFEEAIAWFDKALRLNPRLAVAHFCRAVCFVGLKRDADAYASFRKAYDLDPKEGAYRLELARVCARLGRANEAMDVLGALLHALPALVDDVSSDPSFAGLFDHPRFLAMTGRL
jgi:tetratricopeptide (TPR) repeat protein